MITKKCSPNRVVGKYGKPLLDRAGEPVVPASYIESREDSEHKIIHLDRREDVDEGGLTTDNMGGGGKIWVGCNLRKADCATEYISCGVCFERFEYSYLRIEPVVGFLVECEECEAMNICHDGGMPMGALVHERDCCVICGKECCQSCGITNIT